MAMASGRVLHTDAFVRAADRRTRALQTGQVDLDGGHIDIVWSKGHRSRRLPLTDQVIDILNTCDRTSRTHFASRHMFFVSATGNQVTAATVGKVFGRIWDQAALPRPVAGVAAATIRLPAPLRLRQHPPMDEAGQRRRRDAALPVPLHGPRNL